MEETRNAYPLDWPQGWKRTPDGIRRYGKFNKKERDSNNWQRKKDISIYDGLDRILDQLKMMGIERQDVVISTNVRTRLDGLPRSGEPTPDDPGAAVYWRDYSKPADKQVSCMAIDSYTSVADNLAAIAATLEAMRAIERHGSAEVIDRAYSGFLALPEKATEPWRDVLGLKMPVVTRDAILAVSRDLMRKHHPDLGGDREAFERVVEARDRALKETAA